MDAENPQGPLCLIYLKTESSSAEGIIDWWLHWHSTKAHELHFLIPIALAFGIIGFHFLF